MNEFMQSTSSERLFPFMNSTVFFYIAVASFGCYACWYFDANKETDRLYHWVLGSDL
jgi:hypothetical protein